MINNIDKLAELVQGLLEEGRLREAIDALLDHAVPAGANAGELIDFERRFLQLEDHWEEGSLVQEEYYETRDTLKAEILVWLENQRATSAKELEQVVEQKPHPLLTAILASPSPTPVKSPPRKIQITWSELQDQLRGILVYNGFVPAITYLRALVWEEDILSAVSACEKVYDQFIWRQNEERDDQQRGMAALSELIKRLRSIIDTINEEH
ncbi:MAG: hypothetical protein AAFQ37_09745, partial [Bacteroidota bacterium]